MHVSLWAHSWCRHHCWCLLWDHWTHFGHGCVCKGGGGGVRAPGSSAEINKALWEGGGGIWAGRTSEGSEEGDWWKRGLQTNRNQTPRSTKPKSEGERWTYMHLQSSFFPSKEVVTVQVTTEKGFLTDTACVFKTEVRGSGVCEEAVPTLPC